MSSHQIGDGIINSARTTLTVNPDVQSGKNWVLIGPITATVDVDVAGNMTVFDSLNINGSYDLDVTGNLDIR